MGALHFQTACLTALRVSQPRTDAGGPCEHRPAQPPPHTHSVLGTAGGVSINEG